MAFLAFALAFCLGAVQLGSDAILSNVGAPYSLPARLPPALGVRIYRFVATFAPASFVEEMLARAAFSRGDLAAAHARVLRMPRGPVRSDYLARIAEARGDDAAAQRYLLAAADFRAVQREVERIQIHHPGAAWNLEMRLKTRLERLATHPDAVAESNWHLGIIATRRAWRDSARRTYWYAIGLRYYRRAIALAPLDEKYLLSAAAQELALQNLPGARRYYLWALGVNPASANAYAGLGVVAFHQGDRASARRYAARSRAIDPRALMLRALDRDLR